MKLKDTSVEKADPLLREALQNAEGDEVIRTIMLLDSEGDTTESRGAESDAETETETEELHPSQFSTREEYRRNLIEQQKQKTTKRTRSTMQALLELSLRPVGGAISRAVVVEGSTRQIAAALDLPGVRHAILDRSIQLVEPDKRRRK